MLPDASPTVSIVVPVRTMSSGFDRCIEAIDRLDPAPHEVVVAVDGGVSAVIERATASGARVVVIPERGGPAVARNRGAAFATGSILFFIDADVVVRPSAVGRVIDWFALHPGDTAIIGSYDDEPVEPNFSSQLKNLVNHWYHQNAHDDGSTFWAACGAVRAEAFVRVGGFDEGYREPSVEDIELGYRLRANGERIAVVKDLQVTHLKRWTLSSLVTTDVVRRALPWSALVLRRGEADDDLNVSIRERFAALFAVVGLVVLVVVPWWRPGVVVVAVCTMVQLVLDRRLLAFLARHRGIAFALRAAPMMLAYHAYSAICFGLATLRHLIWRKRVETNPWPGSPRRIAIVGRVVDDGPVADR